MTPVDRLSPTIEALVTQWTGLLRQTAARYGMASGDVDELTQDVRIRVWRALERDAENPSTLASSYVYRTVMSAAFDFLRRQRSARESTSVPIDQAAHLISSAGSPSDSESELVAALDRALTTLPTARRVAVRLHLDGRSRDEIASIMGWSEAKTRNLLYRGLDDLKRVLESARDA
jgi:RNA polymerase sigma-70 factor (ECF subfamily)